MQVLTEPSTAFPGINFGLSDENVRKHLTLQVILK